jgi:hypothetical protein
VKAGDHVRCSGPEGSMERVTMVKVNPTTRTVFVRTVHHDHPRWPADKMVEVERKRTGWGTR